MRCHIFFARRTPLADWSASETLFSQLFRRGEAVKALEPVHHDAERTKHPEGTASTVPLAVEAPEFVSSGQYWWQDAGLRRLYFLICVAILSSSTNGFDGRRIRSMMNGLQTLIYWREYFDFPNGATLGLLNAIQSVGGMLSLPYASLLCDKIGRKYTIVVGGCYVAIGAALQSSSINIGMFIAGRFFSNWSWQLHQRDPSSLLIPELCHPKQRGKVTAVFNTCWYLGSIVAVWTTYGTLRILSDWSWRLPSLLQIAPSAIQLILIWFLPESPRYLISKNRDEEAFDIMATYHANGDRDSEWLSFEFSEIKNSLTAEAEDEKTSWKALIATPGNRKRVAICVVCGLFSQLIGNGLISYYLNIILDMLGYTDPFFQNEINGIYAITSWFEAMGAAFMVDKIGRHPMFLTSNSSMIITFALWILFIALNIERTSGSIGIGAIVMFIHTLAYNLVWASLNVAYPVEILPYHLRAKGLTVLNLSISLALFFGQYVNPIGIKNLGWKYYIVYEAWLVIELSSNSSAYFSPRNTSRPKHNLNMVQLIVVYFLFPETKGATLEEIVIAFDGDDVDNLRRAALGKEV
ncbi:Lactose permease [Paramyrothecium foliicola]|nr:Lactose permease [Paramyrothecium foliicola]